MHYKVVVTGQAYTDLDNINFMPYRIADGTVTVDKIFHQMQDYESKIW